MLRNRDALVKFSAEIKKETITLKCTLSSYRIFRVMTNCDELRWESILHIYTIRIFNIKRLYFLIYNMKLSCLYSEYNLTYCIIIKRIRYRQIIRNRWME